MLSSAVPTILLSTIGSLVAGYMLGRLFSLLTLTGSTMRRAARSCNSSARSAVWILADRLGLSAIITIVVYAMTIARTAPRRMSARSRVSSYSVWETASSCSNVLAFVLMGLQARPIVEPACREGQGEALAAWPSTVLAVVIVARLVWV